MKVISIKEPFATLIADGYKLIETRSWNTNYRGELFIHASGNKLATEFITNDYLKQITTKIKPQFGNIICKVNLVDCVYMDEEFLERVKSDPKEYYCGEYKIGRYAWVFQDVMKIKPIKTAGHLSIWNYDCNSMDD